MKITRNLAPACETCNLSKINGTAIRELTVREFIAEMRSGMVQNLCPTSRGAAAIGFSDRKTRKILQSYFFVISELRSKKMLSNSAWRLVLKRQLWKCSDGKMWRKRRDGRCDPSFRAEFAQTAVVARLATKQGVAQSE